LVGDHSTEQAEGREFFFNKERDRTSFLSIFLDNEQEVEWSKRY
jgi:hypothetical protein